MRDINCPLCHKNIYSGIGTGCKMCGMVLEDRSREFCSKTCRQNYRKINLKR